MDNGGGPPENPEPTAPPLLVDEPLQLINFTRSPNNPLTTITLVSSTLDRVFSQVGDRPLSPICVCGPSRQGKSFLLGYMIRCLEFLESNGDDDWMGDRSKPLHGFKFRNGTVPETQGIWIWSKPFIIKEDGKEIAVLLIDTQGTHDEFTTNKDMNAIVGLSLLLSSQMVFNFFNNLQEDILTSLNTYVQYGTLALERDDSKPFQKLTFLIRDWNIPGEYPYGLEGGEKFLKDKLKLKEGQSSEAKNVREAIKKCFQTLDCFLMPGIGEKALYPTFTGSISELSPAFANKLEIFINKLFSDESLTIKKVMGNEVSASELRRMMETYVEIFNSEEIPSAQTMWEAQMHLNNSSCVEKALEKYRAFLKSKFRKAYLQEEALEKAHELGNEKALKAFNSSKLLGSEEVIKEVEEKLNDLIEKEFKQVKVQNEGRRTKFISSAISDASTSFRNGMEEEFEFENDVFYEEKALKKGATVGEEMALEEFKEKISEEPDDKKLALVRAVRENFETIFSSIINKNMAMRAKAEKTIGAVVISLGEKYEGELKEFIEANKFEDEFPEDFEKDLKAKILQDFVEEEKPGSKQFHAEFQDKLEKLVGSTHSRLMNERRLKIQKAYEDATDLIGDFKDKYQMELEKGVGEEEIRDEGQLDAYHLERRLALAEAFEKEEISFPKRGQVWGKLCKKLEDELDIPCQKIRAEILDKIKRCRDSYKAAVEESFKLYQEGMKELLEDFLEDDELETEHKILADKASERYYEIEKVGCPPDALQIKLGLEEKIEERFKEIFRENEQKRELALSRAKNLISECEAEYEKLIKEEMNAARTSAELEEAHEKVKPEVSLKMRRECPISDALVQEKYVEELEEWMDEAFVELLDIFERKRREEETRLAMLKIDAQQFYHGEMGKHCRNDEFMHPNHLEQLHSEVKSKILKKAEEKERLSEVQVEDLGSYVNGMFGIYEMRNGMGFNSGDLGIGVAPAIGIDLGTTFCCVGVWYKGKVRIIPNNEQGGSLTTPSYVAFAADGSESLGAPAKDNAYQNPENTIYDAKRIIGRKVGDERLKEDMKLWPFNVVEDGGVPKVEVNGMKMRPEEISAKLLAYLKEMVEKFLKLSPDTIKKAVITVPAYFEDGQRKATVDAGVIAGLDVLTILNEPTAAAIAYSLERLDDEPKKILIYDLGGGTFDVAVLSMTPGDIEVLGINGDTHLGGEDFDRKLMEYCAGEFEGKCGVDLLSGKDSDVKQERGEARKRLRRLQTYCEKVKKDLATARLGTVSVDAIANGMDLGVDITRETFERLNEADFKKSIDLVEKTLNEVGLRKEEIDDVVLVGGSSRIPKVQEMLKDYFGKALNCSIHPDHAVAYGAAVKAAQMNGEKAMGTIDFSQIQDVIPMSLGIETAHKDMAVILKKNSKVPSRRMETFTTYKDDQTEVCIQVYQGEDFTAANNRLLGKFTLGGIPMAKKGVETVDVSMVIDLMGILRVEATCKSNSVSESITVTEDRQRLTKEEVVELAEKARQARGPAP